MGGILGRRAWERSNGGLWLPALFESLNRMGFCSSGGCQVFSGEIPETVGLTVSGAANNDCDCDWVNGSYELDCQYHTTEPTIYDFLLLDLPKPYCVVRYFVSFRQACMNPFSASGMVGCRGESSRRTADGREEQTRSAGAA